MNEQLSQIEKLLGKEGSTLSDKQHEAKSSGAWHASGAKAPWGEGKYRVRSSHAILASVLGVVHQHSS